MPPLARTDLGAVEALPIDKIDVSKATLFESGEIFSHLARLRRDEPVHYCPESAYGDYWSITKYKDIVDIEISHKIFSSSTELGGTSLMELPKELRRQSFIGMDPPRHDQHRKIVSPVVAPGNLAKLQYVVRERSAEILDALPVGETFDWVENVSVELTTQMLATLFDFPWEDRHKLPYWSDLFTADVRAGGGGLVTSEEDREEKLMECLDYFTRLWNERINAPPGPDLISMLTQSEEMRKLSQREFFGLLNLLIVGGNDTTRNSISGGVVALNQHPGEYSKLRANPELIISMVPEIIRYQTPIAHMRRTALYDVEFRGKVIKKGERVVMWYLSGNRDADAIENPDVFIIDRARPREHLSFGFGIHRCLGNRLAELQLRILWEEILKRFSYVEVVGEPVRVCSNFVNGIKSLPVKLHA